MHYCVAKTKIDERIFMKTKTDSKMFHKRKLMRKYSWKRKFSLKRICCFNPKHAYLKPLPGNRYCDPLPIFHKFYLDGLNLLPRAGTVLCCEVSSTDFSDVSSCWSESKKHTFRKSPQISLLLFSTRVSISHPFFVSRNTKQIETKKLFHEISLVSRNNINSEISFRFVLFRQK
jgi:hypothetical protein